MNTIMIDYDLIAPGQKYERIIAYVKAHAWANALRSTWLIVTPKSAEQVRDDLLSIVDGNDKLLVTDVTNAQMAWRCLPQDVSNWLQANAGKRLLYR